MSWLYWTRQGKGAAAEVWNPFEPLPASALLLDLRFLRQVELAVRQRCICSPATRLSLPQAYEETYGGTFAGNPHGYGYWRQYGDNAQEARWFRALQLALWRSVYGGTWRGASYGSPRERGVADTEENFYESGYWLRHDSAFNWMLPQDRIPYLAPADWARDAFALGGFRASRDGVNFERRIMEPGDVIGAWLFEDLARGCELLRYTRLNPALSLYQHHIVSYVTEDGSTSVTDKTITGGVSQVTTNEGRLLYYNGAASPYGGFAYAESGGLAWRVSLADYSRIAATRLAEDWSLVPGARHPHYSGYLFVRGERGTPIGSADLPFGGNVDGYGLEPGLWCPVPSARWDTAEGYNGGLGTPAGPSPDAPAAWYSLVYGFAQFHFETARDFDGDYSVYVDYDENGNVVN